MRGTLRNGIVWELHWLLMAAGGEAAVIETERNCNMWDG